VAPRELAARAGLEVSLEEERRRFFVELYDHERSPGAIFRGVWRESGIVSRQPSRDARRHAAIVGVRRIDAREDVDEALGCRHDRRDVKRRAIDEGSIGGLELERKARPQDERRTGTVRAPQDSAPVKHCRLTSPK